MIFRNHIIDLYLVEMFLHSRYNNSIVAQSISFSSVYKTQNISFTRIAPLALTIMATQMNSYFPISWVGVVLCEPNEQWALK